MALLAPDEPGSTLVLSSLRSECVKGFVTRLGTRLVKGVSNRYETYSYKNKMFKKIGRFCPLFLPASNSPHFSLLDHLSLFCFIFHFSFFILHFKFQISSDLKLSPRKLHPSIFDFVIILSPTFAVRRIHPEQLPRIFNSAFKRSPLHVLSPHTLSISTLHSLPSHSSPPSSPYSTMLSTSSTSAPGPAILTTAPSLPASCGCWPRPSMTLDRC